MSTATRRKLVIPLTLAAVLGASVASAHLPRAKHPHRARSPYVPVSAGQKAALAPLTRNAAPPVQVWVNTKTGVYHFPGERWYGNTKSGQMMNEDAARRAGYRSSANGQ